VYYDRIMSAEELKDVECHKPRPDRLFIYSGSKREYDFVDYTGNVHDFHVNISDKTALLEFLGYIKYIDNKEYRVKGK